MGDKSRYRAFNYITVSFVVILIISNIASSAKIVDLGFKIGSFRFAFDGGTLLFPLSYIIGDILTEVYGFRQSRKVIWIGFISLTFSALIFALLRFLPAETNWETEVGSASYMAVLGGISSGGLLLASLLAYLFGELSNAIVLSRLKIRTKGRWLWLRTITSTLVGQGLDSLIFVGIATLCAVFPAELFFTLVLSNYLFKCAFEALCTPLTYLAVHQLKKLEDFDHFDGPI